MLHKVIERMEKYNVKCPKGFIVQYPEDFENVIIGVQSNESKLRVYHKDTKEIYEKDILIWNPAFSYDYWFRHYFSDNFIIISDYNGLKVFDNKLNIIYQKDIEESKKFKEVFGYDESRLFEFDDDDDNSTMCLRYWNVIDSDDINYQEEDMFFDKYKSSKYIDSKDIFKYSF